MTDLLRAVERPAMAFWSRILFVIALALSPVMPAASATADVACPHHTMGNAAHEHHAPADSSAAARSCCAACLVLAVPATALLLEVDRLPVFAIAGEQALEAAGVEPADPPPRV